ncbi:MAG: hypothetical protein WAW52_05995 [Methanothrix sp.]
MEEQVNRKIFDLGDLKIFEWDGENPIRSLDDLDKLENKISREIRYYSLEAILLKIHERSLNEENIEIHFNFVAGMMVKFAVHNCRPFEGWSPLYDEEFVYFYKLTLEYLLYDHEFENLSGPRDEITSSFLLRKIGNQIRWNIPRHNVLGRTFFLFDEMVKRNVAPTFIKQLIEDEFERQFGLSLLDFIKIGFVLYAGSVKSNGMTRNYFQTSRSQGISLPSDEIVKICLELVSADTIKFDKFCNEHKTDNDFRAYELNPLFEYPIIRMLYGASSKSPEVDKFIAPIPDLVIYKFTTGLYYKLFNAFLADFPKAFGELFESYVGIVLRWCNPAGTILSEEDLTRYLPKYKGKKPDWIVFCDEGIIIIECKATKHTQSMYELGLKAKKLTSIDQVVKGVIQINEFMKELPILCRILKYHHKRVMKIILTFEPLMGLKRGPMRNLVDRNNRRKRGYDRIWSPLWIWELEEIQPYVTKGANFWNTLEKVLINTQYEFNNIIYELESETHANYSDGYIYKYENKIFYELTRDTKYLIEN